MAEMIKVEVVYALPERQELMKLHLPVGATARSAIEASGLMQKYPEINLASGKIGIFSRICRPDTVLRDLDRVEIYRSLIADPKIARRQRATQSRVRR